MTVSNRNDDSNLSADSDPGDSEPAQSAETGRNPQGLRKLLWGELPLQTETTFFILINTLDIFMTYILMRFGAIEANPVANLFMNRWGFSGLIVFKLFIVAFVCVISQIVAMKKPAPARFLLISGSILVGLVVIYSVSLFATHFL